MRRCQGHHPAPNLWPLSVLHTKHGRSRRRAALRGVRGEEQRQGAEALRDNESPVDAFHTFRHLFVTGRLHYKKLALDSSPEVSITHLVRERCRPHIVDRHGVVNSSSCTRRSLPILYWPWRTTCATNDASIEALFLSPPLRRWVRAHETSSGCRKISVPANRRSLALEGAAADAAAAATDGWMDGSCRGVGYKVTAVSELRSHKVSARTLGLDDDDAAWQ